ncbi:MAG: hypothetical protein IH618_15825 [Ignavibacteriaceae bacterium]|nr:hypothetical protein [Ignavibacteriaceae bacterium]
MNNTPNRNSIIIVADSPIINPKEIKSYPNLSVNYSVYLNTLLYSNWLEILSGLKEQVEIFTILNEKDMEFIPKYFLPDKDHTITYNEPQLTNLTDYLLKRPISPNSKSLVLFYNSIGIMQNDILRIFNLLQAEEPSIVIGKSVRDKIILACTNGLDVELIDSILAVKRNYDDYLSYISSKDIFIHTLSGFLSIDNFEDIKKLYIELSKKESLSYCSQKMHENFNDLFIEYKELLNV